MPFWLLVLIIVTLIALCWGGGWGIYRPERFGPSALLGVLGLILFIVLVIIFIQGTGTGTVTVIR